MTHPLTSRQVDDRTSARDSGRVAARHHCEGVLMLPTSCPKPAPRKKKEPKPPRAKNAKRSADNFARAYGSEARVEWVKAQPCVVAGCRKPSENVHIEGDGMARKSSYEKVIPCCSMHHGRLHTWGREEFEGAYLVDLAALALDTERCYRRFAGHFTETQPQ